MIYVTGDTHRNFERIEEFCNKQQTTKEDLMIILGDAGVNYYGPDSWQDSHVKKKLESLPISFLFVHGNHEMRPETIPSYHLTSWKWSKEQGSVYMEDDYPSLAFAKDGEIYNLNNAKILVCGGAYSVDKYYRLVHLQNWWDDEQPSDAVKIQVERQVKDNDDIKLILTHTCPFRYQPTEAFLPMIDQNTVDTSTERWLDTIYDLIPDANWACGHFHIDKLDNNVRFIHQDVLELNQLLSS